MKNVKISPFVDANGAYQNHHQADYTRNKYKREFDRLRLPTPESYYKTQFEKLKINSKQVNVICCFHHETTPSLSLNLVDGHFRCFGCGAKGHDILAFHRLRYSLNFVDAVTELGAWHE